MKKNLVIIAFTIILTAISCCKTEYGFKDYENVIFVFQKGDWIVCQNLFLPINTFTSKEFDLMNNRFVNDSTYVIFKILSFYKWNTKQYARVMTMDTMLKVPDPNFCNIDTSFIISHCRKDTAGLQIDNRSDIVFKIYPCERDSIKESAGFNYKVKGKKWR